MRVNAWLLSAMAGLTVAAAGMFWAFNQQPEENTEQDSNAVTIHWHTGSSRQYSVVMDSTMQMQLAGAQGKTSLPVGLSSTLTILTLEAEHNSALVGIALSGVELVISGQLDADTGRAIEAPFRARFVDGGLPTVFEFPETVNAEHRAILENLVRTFQIADKPAKTSWQAEEANATGRYLASYSRSGGTPAQSTLTKSKSRFEALPIAPILLNAEISSKELITIDADLSWLSSMTVIETLSSSPDSDSSVTVENRATLKALDKLPTTVDADSWSFVAADAAVSTASSAAPQALSPEQAREALISRLPQLDAATQGRTTHIHSIRDLLRTDDSLPAALLVQLQTEALSDRTRADLYLALELAGTGAAQAALRAVIANPDWSSKDAVRAIVALGGVAQPDSETVASLWAATGTGDNAVASTATFALGSVGRTLDHAGSPEYAGIRDGLLTGAFNSAEPEQRADFLMALGNTQDPGLANDVATLFDDSEKTVRRAAIMSAGMIGNQDNIEKIASRLDYESSAEVREAIVKSLGALSSSDAATMQKIAAAIRTEPDERARLAMASFLGGNLGTHRDYEPLLRDLLRHEPSKRVREALAEALATTLTD